MSQKVDRLYEFFDWLLRPRRFPQPDSEWKERHLKKLSRMIRRLENYEAMPPSEEFKNAIAWLRKYEEKVRHGSVYVVHEYDRKGRRANGFRFLMTGSRLRRETERRFLAVLIAGLLYPKESAYEKVRKEFKKRGLNCQAWTLRQGFHRLLEGLKGDRTQAVFNIASAFYGQFRCQKLATSKPRPKKLVLSASESDLLRRIAEGWQFTFRKNR